MHGAASSWLPAITNGLDPFQREDILQNVCPWQHYHWPCTHNNGQSQWTVWNFSVVDFRRHYCRADWQQSRNRRLETCKYISSLSGIPSTLFSTSPSCAAVYICGLKNNPRKESSFHYMQSLQSVYVCIYDMYITITYMYRCILYRCAVYVHVRWLSTSFSFCRPCLWIWSTEPQGIEGIRPIVDWAIVFTFLLLVYVTIYVIKWIIFRHCTLH